MLHSQAQLPIPSRWSRATKAPGQARCSKYCFEDLGPSAVWEHQPAGAHNLQPGQVVFYSNKHIAVSECLSIPSFISLTLGAGTKAHQHPRLLLRSVRMNHTASSSSPALNPCICMKIHFLFSSEKAKLLSPRLKYFPSQGRRLLARAGGSSQLRAGWQLFSITMKRFYSTLNHLKIMNLVS